MNPNDFVWWALRQAPAGTRQTGVATAKLVLIALALHASSDGIAYPGQDTIAEETGLDRRTVRNSLALLDDQGFIKKVGSAGRAIKYQLQANESYPQLAGYPANPELFEMAGAMAGQLAGASAGASAGYPAANRTEQNRTPPTPKRSNAPDRSLRVVEEEGIPKQREKPANEIAPALQSALRSHGIPDRDMSAVLQAAQADPETTYPEGRLTKSKTYALGCWATIKSARTAALNSGPRCEDHTDQPAKHCTSCISDVKCGDRHPDYIGRRMPANRTA